MKNDNQVSPEEIGLFLKKLREENKMTQDEVAERIHFTRAVISQIERGLSVPSYEKARSFAEIYKVSIAEIYAAKKLSEETVKNVNPIIENVSDTIQKKYSKKAKCLSFVIIILVLFLISFLVYYFLNSYSATKVYKIYGESENFKTNEGILMISRDKMYLSLDVKTKKDFIIDEVSIRYSKDNEDNRIYASDSPEIFLSDSYGYEAYFNYDDIVKNVGNFYIEVQYNGILDRFNLNIEKLYENKKLIFNKDKKESSGDAYNVKELIPSKILKDFKKENNIYNYQIESDESQISITYNPDNNELIVMEQKKDNSYNWIYNLEYKILDYELIDNKDFSTLESKSIDTQKVNKEEKEIYNYFKENYIDKYLN